jgi:hypothetical protein
LTLLLGCSGASTPEFDAGLDDAAKGDAIAKMDAAKDTAGGGQNFTSTPGQIDCGPMSCPSMSGFSCCMQKMGTSTMYQCGDPGACGAHELECEESADCAQGQVCCHQTTMNGSRATCETTCGNNTQLCKKSAECVMGSCAAFNCPAGVLHACAKPGGCM